MLQRSAFLLFVLLCLPSSFLLAQGRIIGRVTDSTGNPLAATIVSLSSDKRNGAVVTNAEGYYSFPGLPPGEYVIRFSKTGLSSLLSQVSLTANATMLVNARLVARAEPLLAASGGLGSGTGNVTRKSPSEKSATKPPPPAIKRPDKKAEEEQPLEAAAPAPPSALPVAESSPAQDTVTALLVTSNQQLADSNLQRVIKQAEAVEALRTTVDENARNNRFERRAEIIGGTAALYQHLKYPAVARASSQPVVVAARVYVDEIGQVIKVDMIKSGSPAFNEEVYRVLTESVKFSPAQLAGAAPTADVITLVVNFKPN